MVTIDINELRIKMRRSFAPRTRVKKNKKIYDRKKFKKAVYN